MGEKLDKAADFVAHEVARGRDELAQALFHGHGYVTHPSHEPMGVQPEQGGVHGAEQQAEASAQTVEPRYEDMHASAMQAEHYSQLGRDEAHLNATAHGRSAEEQGMRVEAHEAKVQAVQQSYQERAMENDPLNQPWMQREAERAAEREQSQEREIG